LPIIATVFLFGGLKSVGSQACISSARLQSYLTVHFRRDVTPLGALVALQVG
jgi:hypothetical protein